MAIKYIENRNLWILETKNTAYCFAKYKDGHIKNTYYGPKLVFESDYPGIENYIDRDYWLWDEELPVRGEGNFVEHNIKINFEDGTRDVVLELKDFIIKKNELKMIYVDTHYNVQITTVYNIKEEFDLIERHQIIENNNENIIKIEDAKSGTFYIPNKKEAKINYLTGMWIHEFQKRKEPINEGKKILESRLGKTSAFLNPFIAVDYSANQSNGEIFFGLVKWSGNWKIEVQKQLYERIAVTMGLNEWDFNIFLNPGKCFETPEIVFGYTNQGFDYMTHCLHSYTRKKILPENNSDTQKKVLYNSWEATLFDVNEENQKELAKKAADIGIELFVMDDGWFGNRNDDSKGLGDWFVNKNKFPDGLTPLIEYVNKLGMDFGLWVEPEMVNPNSELYRKHPEWVLHFPNRPKTEKRNQLILNIAKQEVKEYILEFMNDLLNNHNIKYIKWDMNRYVFESGWPEKNSEKQKEIWYYYVKNLYDIMISLRKNHPEVIFENCSSGGGRVDLGIMNFYDEVWPSDNTNPFDRQYIQEGFSMVYPTSIMRSWVTDWEGKNTYPLDFRFKVSMAGSLGIGSNLKEFDIKDIEIAKKNIELYKQIRNVIQHGKYYLLNSIYEDNYQALQYTKNNDTVLFVYINPKALNNFSSYNIKLRGLEEKSLYKIEETGENLSGKALMERGITIYPEIKIDAAIRKKDLFTAKLFRFRKDEKK
ncbi:MAG: alpha-galactosidase [Thermotogota bacterium]